MIKIINADDFGYSPEFNKAIKICFKEGFISSTTIMMNMPYCNNAIEMAFKDGFETSVGLHFNLIEGQPLTQRIRKCERLCKDGLLSYKRNSVFFWSREEKLAIKEEFEAQLYALIDSGITPTHIDSHQHSHTELPIFNIIKDSILDAGINKIRLSRNVGISKTRIFAKRIVNSYIRSFGFKTTRFFNDISQPEINQSLDNIEIMCHPFLKNGIVVDAFRGIQINKQEDNIVNYNKI